MPTLKNTNIAFLSLPQNRKLCLLVRGDDCELIELVPIVWKRIELSLRIVNSIESKTSDLIISMQRVLCRVMKKRRKSRLYF